MIIMRSEKRREWERKNRVKLTANAKAWREANPDSVKEHYQNAKPKRKAIQLKINYGISLEEWNSMLIAQEFQCAICKTSDPGDQNSKAWQTDHCHETGKVRGILCRQCNLGLGYFKDNVKALQEAIAYLEKIR
jgi:nitrate/TMAO reductase-like tetraheme cytochrome c subunit